MVELDGEDFGDMDDVEMSGMDNSHMNSELEPGSSPDKPEAANAQADEQYMADRAKKQTGLDQIKESVKELHEVIAYMDYSFERAFTIQEKEYMLAYKVRNSQSNSNVASKKTQLTIILNLFSTMHTRSKKTSMSSKLTLQTMRNKKKRKKGRFFCSSNDFTRSDPRLFGWTISLKRTRTIQRRGERELKKLKMTWCSCKRNF